MRLIAPAFRRAITSTLLLLSLASAVPAAAQSSAAAPPKKSFWPTAAELKAAVSNALQDPATWIPAAGAVAVAAGGWDRSIVRWAGEHHPVFGSTSEAIEASSNLRTASHITMVATALFAEEARPGLGAIATRQATEHGGAITATLFTGLFKSAIGRERPDGSSERSFPSGHASRAAAYSAFSVRNINSTGIAPPAKWMLVTGVEALSFGTAWARVEAGAHYPSDVLAGAALGNFVGAIVHDLFVNRGSDITPDLRMSGRHISAGLSITF